jgi:RHS repeat-associated protein
LYEFVRHEEREGIAHTFTYDAEGNVTAVDGGSTAQYVYNALNQRVSENLGGTTTQFAYNVAGQRVSIWNTASPNGQLQEEYYVGNKRVAYFANNMLHFQHQDGTGTERMRTTFNGAVEGSFTSLPFGDAFGTVSGIDGDPYHYGMLDHDYASDTDHAQFRQYSSTPGRWMSPDPYSGSYHMRNPQSFNRYTYALNNPLRFVDPSGLILCDYGMSDAGPNSGNEDVEDDDSDDECTGSGGTVISDNSTVNVNGDDNSGGILEMEQDADDSIFIEYLQFTGQDLDNEQLLVEKLYPDEGLPLTSQWPFNGDIWPGFTRQDGVCSTGPLANSMNSNPAILSCCQAHDACYTQYHCNATSFIPGGFPGPCKSVCNAGVVKCIAGAEF